MPAAPLSAEPLRAAPVPAASLSAESVPASVLSAAGVGRGDRVAILLANEAGAEAHTAYHASHRLGAINVPLNTRYVERELRAYLARGIHAHSFLDG